MGKIKKIVPEFMLDNPNDSFIFLMPLSLKLDKEEIGNSYFEVAVKNLTQNEHFTSLIAPEVFFTHFKLHRVYKVGKLDKNINKKLQTFTRTYPINTIRLPKEQYDTNLNECLDRDFIGQLLGYKHKYLEQAKQTFCCVMKFGKGIDLIIPHSVIAIYYYYCNGILSFVNSLPRSNAPALECIYTILRVFFVISFICDFFIFYLYASTCYYK